jgi:ribosome-binding protein aMBF1 (putative translation factor)
MNRIKYIDPKLKEAFQTVSPSVQREVDISFDIAKRISDLLTVKHMSQADLARACNKKPALVSRWLSGTHNFTIQTIAVIETALGASIITVQKSRKARKT